MNAKWGLVGPFVALIAASAWGQTVYTAPDDDITITQSSDENKAEIYYVEFAFERPRWITVDKKGKDGKAVSEKFFYMPYKVVNYGDKNVEFRPDFVLHTSTGKEYRTEINTAAFEAIKKQLRRQPAIPDDKRDSLYSPIDMKGVLAAGESNQKHSVAIWKEFDPAADEFAVFVGALTNFPVRQFKNPLFKPDQADLKVKQEEYFQQTRVLKISFVFPGYETGRDKSYASVEKAQWVWRGN